MSDLTLLKKKRGSLKKRLTDFDKYINDKNSLFESGENLNRRTIIEIEGRLERNSNLLDLFYEINSEIEELDSSDIEREQKLFEDDYFAAIAKAKFLTEELNTSTQIPNISQTSTSENSLIKLPTIHLPKFKGVNTNWLEFRDIFHSMIHTNEALSKVQKFYYLKSALESEAANVIQSIKLSNDNYDIAWSLLCERFNNKRILVQNHVRALYSVDQISKESSTSLRQLINNVNHHLRSLKILGIDTGNWDAVIIYFITAKLDALTAREWESQIFGSEIPTLSELLNFLKNRADMLDNLKCKVNDFKSNKSNINNMLSNISCHFCNASHTIYACEKFKALPVDNRISEIKRLKLCVNCLRPGHSCYTCNSLGCKICKHKHNSLLHLNNKKASEEATTSELVANVINNSYVLLSTALIQVRGAKGKMHTLRALLDNGSQSSFITEKAKNKLQIKSDFENNDVIKGINNTQSNIKGRCKLFIQSLHSSYCVNTNFYILPTICSTLPQLNLEINKLKIPENIINCLADANFNVPGDIDILLGANIVSKIMTSKQIDLGKNYPTICSSRLGWIISGPIPLNNSVDLMCNFTRTVDIQEQLSRFWDLEEIPSSKPLSDDELQCERNFLESHTRNDQGRFVVRIPLKLSTDNLGNSSIGAQRRFYSLERKLQANSSLKELYCDFMRDYETLEHMTRISVNHNDQLLYFLPHHSVLREHSTTTRLRVVFDASFSTDSGYSRNNIEHVGPVVQDDLFSILIRFRQHSIAISADIKKMYRQVLIHPDDRHLQVIYWRSEPSEPLKVFQLNTITYGTASGSYLATRCLRELAKLKINSYPEASRIIEHDFYVDDLLTGSDNLDNAQLLCAQIDSILKGGCFELDKWASNKEEIFNNIFKRKNSLNDSISISTCKEGTKILGLHWLPSEDSLYFKINLNSSKKTVTKRTILSLISQIFDPLGLLSACLITGKIILQHLWQERIEWDDIVPKAIEYRWLDFSTNLMDLNNLRIPRYVFQCSPQFIEIHGFADASEKAYAACLYIRSIDKFGNISSRLLCAKSKVAPVKTLTIPKLELCAALVLSKLTRKVLTSLRLTINNTYLWTDSTVVLGWLGQSENVLKVFVAHRVAEIRNLVGNVLWKHVPSENNPADLASRGISSNFIINSDLWWHGPHWLREESHCWPQLNINKAENLPELKKTTQITLVNLNNTPEIINFNKFSTLTSLQKTVAYVVRFLNNSRKPRKQRDSGYLKSHEMTKALLIIIKILQRDNFGKEMIELKLNGVVNPKSKILSLTPFLDDKEILRVGGRLENSELEFGVKHPIILPTSNHVVDLMFKYEHIRLGHAGPTQLLSSIRDKFWPIKGKNVAKRTARTCVRCFRARPFNKPPLMGALPANRVIPTLPFRIIGIDYAGPFLIRNRKGRGAKTLKCYISLFVCFCTKAIHIEVTTDYTSKMDFQLH